MTVAYKTNARWICSHPVQHGSDIASDGEGGPDDGVNHLHPEHVFNHDLHSRGFPKPHLH